MWEGKEDSTGKKGRPVVPGNKDNWMIGSNPSLGFFYMATSSVPWHFLMISLLFFGDTQNEKCQASVTWWEATGSQKRISGYLFIQCLRESGDPSGRWGPSPR